MVIKPLTLSYFLSKKMRKEIVKRQMVSDVERINWKTPMHFLLSFYLAPNSTPSLLINHTTPSIHLSFSFVSLYTIEGTNQRKGDMGD
jgi:hypothetical protein